MMLSRCRIAGSMACVATAVLLLATPSEAVAVSTLVAAFGGVGVWASTEAVKPVAAQPLQSPPILADFTERQLGTFLNQNVGPAFGVLLGVGEGRLAVELLQTWTRGVLFLVDPYIHLSRGYYREANVDDNEHQRNYENIRETLRVLPDVKGRFSFVREFSFSVPKYWIEKQWGPPPKFIYHDANPSYHAVRTDLEAWWPMLPAGGIFAGRNYTNLLDGAVVGVRRAVDEFAAANGLQVFLTNDPSEPTWIVIKD
eukprot:TRINITY_DN8565_c0_g1_i2.p1 TRINITY_DN8565_c0_g1~~TRINITY_DN8565_c0_g1_i2.p1  ORF type:complete len:255 (+),score=30.09 TRINITY_DN8565_c0_g1_i2:53-817(+)